MRVGGRSQRPCLASFVLGGLAPPKPPVRSNGAPTGTLPVGTTQTTLSLTTDEAEALAEEGKALGLDTVWYGEQYRFLMGAGMMTELLAMEESAASEEERLKNRLALKKLILPDGGMGDTFKVLVQAKGVPSPRLLCMGDWGKF